ncbi:MAG: hypothetical protein JST59_26545 [Actinobacteria bacterium]|nr:hypothetical protein [Actinomycetota bacterium]
MSRRRTATLGSLVRGIVAVALAIALAIYRFPRGIAVLACLRVALVAGWRRCGAKGWCASSPRR